MDTAYHLDEALSGKHKELTLGDVEDGDLVKIEEDDDEVANGAFEIWPLASGDQKSHNQVREQDRCPVLYFDFKSIKI